MVCSQQTYHALMSHSKPSPEGYYIFHPANGKRLNWREYTVGLQLAQGCLRATRSDAGEIRRTTYLKVANPIL